MSRRFVSIPQIGFVFWWISTEYVLRMSFVTNKALKSNLEIKILFGKILGKITSGKFVSIPQI